MIKVLLCPCTPHAPLISCQPSVDECSRFDVVHSLTSCIFETQVIHFHQLGNLGLHFWGNPCSTTHAENNPILSQSDHERDQSTIYKGHLHHQSASSHKAINDAWLMLHVYAYVLCMHLGISAINTLGYRGPLYRGSRVVPLWGEYPYKKWSWSSTLLILFYPKHLSTLDERRCI